jgi:hypothetical protein
LFKKTKNGAWAYCLSLGKNGGHDSQQNDPSQQSIALKKLRVVLQKKYFGITSIVAQSDKYEEPAIEYSRCGIIVPEWNHAGRGEMTNSKGALMISEDFIDKRRILLVSELSY